MIHEYAIQPEVLIEWAKTRRDFKMFEKSFGLGTTRIISTFPTQQSRRLRSYLLRKLPTEMDELAIARYVEIVTKIAGCLAIRKSEKKDIPLEEWEALVIAEDQVNPFGMILSENPLNVERNLTPDGVYELDELWEHPTQVVVFRTSESIYSSLKGLLELSREKIIIADPYGYTSGAIRFIVFMLSELKNVIEWEDFPEVHLIFDANKAAQEHIQNEILKQLSCELCDSKLKVRGIAKFHNRYIFTEHGGVQIGHGISLSGDHTEDDDVILLSKDTYEQRLEGFVQKV